MPRRPLFEEIADNRVRRAEEGQQPNALATARQRSQAAAMQGDGGDPATPQWGEPNIPPEVADRIRTQRLLYVNAQRAQQGLPPLPDPRARKPSPFERLMQYFSADE